MNQITHWLDASLIYGSGEDQAEQLRLFERGELRSEVQNDDEEMMPSVGSNCRGPTTKCFLAGKNDRNTDVAELYKLLL